ncbi:hypothetical protein V6Z12_A11G348000 [Gossypium hirsutum]
MNKINKMLLLLWFSLNAGFLLHCRPKFNSCNLEGFESWLRSSMSRHPMLSVTISTTNYSMLKFGEVQQAI